jgi:membrane associated rhomboid family serine protease
MLLIPVGHENSRVSRFPVISTAMVIACLVAFAQTWPRCQEEQSELGAVFESIRYKASFLRTAAREDSEDRESETEAEEASGPKEYLDSIEKTIEKRTSGRISEEEQESLAELKTEIDRARGLLTDRVFFHYGLVPGDFRPIGLLTHMFLHGGYLHLIFNLIFFLLVAPTLENLWGRIIFPIVYVLGGFAAALGFMLVSGPIMVPMVGASGAIAALMGSFLMAFTQTRIKMCCVLLLPFPRVFTFATPAWVFLPFWASWEVYQGLVQLGTSGAGGGGVAHWAHVAGFLFGMGVPYSLHRTGLDRKLFPLFSEMSGQKKVRSSAADPTLQYMHDPDFRRATEERDDCNWAEAARIFAALTERYPEALGPRLELAETYRLDGEVQQRRQVLLESVELAARSKDGRMLEIYDDLRFSGQAGNLSPECLFRIAVLFERSGRVADAAEHFRRFIQQYPQHEMKVRAEERLAQVLGGPRSGPRPGEAGSPRQQTRPPNAAQKPGPGVNAGEPPRVERR